MKRKEQMFWFLSHNKMWCIPLCLTAFSLLPSSYIHATSIIDENTLIVNSTQQQRIVKGTVIDANGEPLIGVNVKEVGGTTGTITDINGEFSLNVAPKTRLEISFIGYQTQNVAVGESRQITVTLQEDTQVLDEVVITGFGMSQKKATLTGAVSSIKSEEIARSSAVTAGGALVGKIAGVNTRQQDGRPGAETALQIRNMGTPLFVIDGVISDTGQFSQMDFNDIESISVLKDASAALYGVRAANGVVVVTTKKGKAGVSRISYTGEFTTRLVPSYNDFNIMNSQDQMGVYKEMQQKGWLNFAETSRTAESGVYGKMYQLINTYDPTTGQYALLNTDEAKNAYLREAEMRNTDWFDTLFSPSLSQNHSVSLSSGTEKSSFYASLSAMHDPGWYKQSGVDRYTANLI